jgi:murein DD-endopeptidase MepM/ murein hydrolase activator NlpD
MCVSSKSRVAAGMRAATAISLLLLTTACSSSLTRFDLPLFGEEPTGSVAPPAAVGYGNSAPQVNVPQLPTGSVASVNTPAAPAANELTSGFSEVTIQPGDTLYSLSRRYGVSERNILAANSLDSATDIQAGRTMMIPPASYRPEQATPQSGPSRSLSRSQLGAASNPGATNGSSQFHVVQNGDTAYNIARRYNMTPAELAERNNLESPDKIRLGQRLNVGTQVASAQSGSQTTITQSGPATIPTSTTQQATTAPVPSVRPTQVASNGNASVQTVSVNTNVQSGAALPEPEAMSSSQFRWPVRGRIISPFGPKSNGANNDGINISVPEGTSIKAAENGVVAYAGNELEGFGNLILIRHQNGFVTAYAHSSTILVQRGDQVRRGQVIARAGQTGSVDTPQLHFELRQASRPIDPIPHMAGS